MSHLEREGDDALDLHHRIAATNMGNIPYALKDQKVFGRVSILPVPFEWREKIDLAMEKIEEAVRPTVMNATRRHTVAEVQDKIYRNLIPKLSQFKQCMIKARLVDDVNFCAGKLEQFLREDALEHAKTIIRDY
jgi:hypothetical protein